VRGSAVGYPESCRLSASVDDPLVHAAGIYVATLAISVGAFYYDKRKKARRQMLETYGQEELTSLTQGRGGGSYGTDADKTHL
jgi:hypothetical protein